MIYDVVLGRGSNLFVVELVRQGRLGRRQILLDLLRSGHIGFHAVAVVHGPPVVILEPIAGPEVVHVHDAEPNVLAFGIEGLDTDVEVVGVLCHWGLLLAGGLGDLLGHFISIYVRTD